MTSSRFVLAVHLMTLIASAEGEPVTSEYAAGSISTNPAFVRRIAMSLKKAGLLTAQLGTGGGLLLGRAESKITLFDIYRAVESQELFGMHRTAPNINCPVGAHIQPVLGVVLNNAERAVERELGAMTLAHLRQNIEKAERRRTASR